MCGGRISLILSHYLSMVDLDSKFARSEQNCVRGAWPVAWTRRGILNVSVSAIG
jgi:hypothetical protein